MSWPEVKFEPESQINPWVLCPVCECFNVHPTHSYQVKGNDSGDAGWQGRGDLHALGFWGECGHNFEVCFGFHKGSTYVFSRVLPSQDGDE